MIPVVVQAYISTVFHFCQHTVSCTLYILSCRLLMMTGSPRSGIFYILYHSGSLELARCFYVLAPAASRIFAVFAAVYRVIF